MQYSWKQKKEIMSEFIMENYAPLLTGEGFVSYQDAGFNWYKVKNGLLYTVRMPIYSPAAPIDLRIGFGVVPLFSWEYIVYTIPMRDWSMDFERGCDHFCPVISIATYEMEKSLLGALPRAWDNYMNGGYTYDYRGLEISHWVSEAREINLKVHYAFEGEPSFAASGLFDYERYQKRHEMTMQLLNQSRKGAELFEELVFPALDKLNTVKSIYEWNKKMKILSSTSIMTDEVEGDPCTIIDGGLFSVAFADECLYCGDEKWYPFILKHLDAYKDFEYHPKAPCRPKTKQEKIDFEETKNHARELIRVIENGDRNQLMNELRRNQDRMISQIKEKLPNLSMDSISLIV